MSTGGPPLLNSSTQSVAPGSLDSISLITTVADADEAIASSATITAITARALRGGFIARARARVRAECATTLAKGRNRCRSGPSHAASRSEDRKWVVALHGRERGFDRDLAALGHRRAQFVCPLVRHVLVRRAHEQVLPAPHRLD